MLLSNSGQVTGQWGGKGILPIYMVAVRTNSRIQYETHAVPGNENKETFRGCLISTAHWPSIVAEKR
jgi:hypothetical protein